MKILALSEDIPFISGGRLTFFRMCRLLARKFPIQIISCDGATETILGPHTIEDRIRIPKLRIVRYLVFQFLAFLKVLRTQAFDVLFVNAGMCCGLAVLLGKLRGKRVIELHHDIIEKHQIKQFAGSTFKIITALIRYLLMYGPLKFVDVIFAASLHTKSLLKKKFTNKPIIFVGNPVEIKREVEL